MIWLFIPFRMEGFTNPSRVCVRRHGVSGVGQQPPTPQISTGSRCCAIHSQNGSNETFSSPAPPTSARS
jgi:hypothetical protein